MFDIGSQLTIMKSVVRSADSSLSHLPTRATYSRPTCLIRKVGRLYEESLNDYGESAGALALESADSELESSEFDANSSVDPAKVGVCVQALRIYSMRHGQR